MRPQHLGMHHLALFVPNLEECLNFYQELIGMTIEWNPDPDNYYLTSGSDNLALHRGVAKSGNQALDHLGFIVATMADVDAWYEYLLEHNIEMITPAKTHRDGARSFYCLDPAGNKVQIIYHPPLSDRS